MKIQSLRYEFNSTKYSKRKIIIIIDSSWAEDFKHLEYKYKEAVPTYFRKTTSSKYLNNGSVWIDKNN